MARPTKEEKLTLNGKIDGKSFEVKDEVVVKNETGIADDQLLANLKSAETAKVADATKANSDATIKAKAEDEAAKAKAVKKVDDFEFDKFYQIIQVPEDVNIPNSPMVDKTILKPEIQAPFYVNGVLNRNSLHAYKCKLTAAKKFNVSVDHLQKAYSILNGKKIDDVYAIDIFDRYGFMNGGKGINRVDLALKYKRSVFSIEVCEAKLKKIVKYENVMGAYARYLADVKNELDKAFKDGALTGNN